MKKMMVKKIRLNAEVIGNMGLSAVTGGADTGFCPDSVTCSAKCITVQCTELEDCRPTAANCGTGRGC